MHLLRLFLSRFFDAALHSSLAWTLAHPGAEQLSLVFAVDEPDDGADYMQVLFGTPREQLTHMLLPIGGTRENGSVCSAK